MSLFWKLNIKQTKQNKKKNPNVTDFVKETKLTELENKIPDVSSLATKTALTAIENKIRDVSSLVKKTNWHKNQRAWKKNLLIIITTNTLLLQSLTLYLLFLMND